MVSFQNLRCVRGEQLVFENLSGCVPRAAIIGMWGPNGVGKTTLLESLAGWRTPIAGSIKWEGENAPILIPTSDNLLLFPWYRISKILSIYADLAHRRGYERTALDLLDSE